MAPSIINQRKVYSFPTVKLRISQPWAKHNSIFLIKSSCTPSPRFTVLKEKTKVYMLLYEAEVLE